MEALVLDLLKEPGQTDLTCLLTPSESFQLFHNTFMEQLLCSGGMLTALPRNLTFETDASSSSTEVS